MKLLPGFEIEDGHESLSNAIDGLSNKEWMEVFFGLQLTDLPFDQMGGRELLNIVSEREINIADVYKTVNTAIVSRFPIPIGAADRAIHATSINHSAIVIGNGSSASVILFGNS